MTWAEFVAECIPTPITIMVEPWTGAGAYGDVYDAAIEVTPCVVEDVRRAVVVQTVDAQGEEVLSSTTVFAPLSPEIVPGSRVTLPWRTGRPARVLAVQRLLAHGQQLPEHQELALE